MSVENEIRKVIKKQGYVCVDELMKTAMSSFADSYYRSKQPLGPTADFITSPEISQMFGEIIGLWCVSMWEKMGRPNPFNLLELGPGRGLLMRDLLRATKNINGFHEAMQIQMLEINPRLIAEQKAQLNDRGISWIGSINHIAELPTVIIANEFFDALPVRQYIKVKEDWHEVALVIDPDDGMLKFDKRPMMPRIFAGQINLDHFNAKDGAIVEESQESIEIIQFIAEHMKRFNGSALIIDYGYYIMPMKRENNQYMGTLQAVKNHKFAPLLSSLGDADLSAHVDFYSLANAARARGIKICDINTQGEFLKEWGIEIRLKSLQEQSPELKEVLARQADRLVLNNMMGKLFKVIEMSAY